MLNFYKLQTVKFLGINWFHQRLQIRITSKLIKQFDYYYYLSIIESIRSTIDTLDPDHSYSVVLGGDFNFIQDTVLDSDGGKPSLKTSSVDASVQLQNARDLVGIWRSRKPHVKRFIDKKPFPSKTTRLFSNFQLLARPC